MAMRSRRLAAVTLLLVVFGLLWRSESPPFISDPVARLWPIATVAPQSANPGQAVLAGAWLIESDDRYAGGYSALDMMPDGRLLALSDNYLRAISFVPPGIGRQGRAQIFKTGGGGHIFQAAGADIEALTHDGRHIWVVSEADATVIRYSFGWLPQTLAKRAEWARLPFNQQVEAFQRLPDGRFVAIAECFKNWFGRNTHPGYVYASDPATGGRAEGFTFSGPVGYHPTDMTVLPDGSLAVLLRATDWPALNFRAKIFRVNPALIRPGAQVAGSEIADIRLPGMVDNMEGIAAQALPGGDAMLWVVSDNNRSRLLQRSLLLAYRWRRQSAIERAAPRAAR